LLTPFLAGAGCAAEYGEEGPAVRSDSDGQEWRIQFYKSWPWRRCRDGYLQSVGGLCERCLKAGLIVPADQVHHKIRVTQDNLNNPEVTLNWGNLEALCLECHQKEHEKPKRWRCDPESGHITL
jgi:5-methylcytosine-specific restriction endonuclease McrA